MGKNMPEEVRAGFTEPPRLSAGSLVFLSAVKREWLSGRYVNWTWDVEEEFTSQEKKREIVEGNKLKVRLVV